MRMIKLGVAAAAIAMASIGSAPAQAQDAAASFASANTPGGSFTFGSTNGTAFLPFTNATGCPTGTTCLQSNSDTGGGLFLPGVYKASSPAGATIFNTISIPGGGLVVHPGPATGGADSVYSSFTAALAGVYSYVATFRVADTQTGLSNPNSNGVSISSFGPSGTSFLTNLTGPLGNSYSTNGTVTLAQGDTFGFIVGNAGSYFYDGTALSFVVTAAPEPAAWLMMIFGFGLIGGALRRKSAAQLATAA